MHCCNLRFTDIMLSLLKKKTLTCSVFNMVWNDLCFWNDSDIWID